MVTARPGVLLLGAWLLAPFASAQGKKPPPPGWKVEPFAIEKASAGFRLALQGYLQADFRSFRDWTAGDEESGNLRADDFEWRRLRIGLEGRYKRLSFELDVDPAFDEGDELKDAWLDVRAARELRFRGGNMKLPVSPERLTSAGKTDFLERSAAVDALAPDRDAGGLLHGEFGRALDYEVGLFTGDGRARRTRAETTAAARLVLTPHRGFGLGGSFSQGDVRANPAGSGLDPQPKGLAGASLTGYRFFPPMFVEGRRLRWGADARIQAGPVSAWGEFLEAREERRGQGPTLEDLPEVRGEGWSVTGTWLVTGDEKARTIRPRRGLFAGPGAVELSARYEELRFDDVENEGFESAGSRAANIRPGGLRAFTGGLSWWPSTFLRFVGNVIVERYDDALRAPQTGKKGDYVSLVGRIQVHLP